MTTVEKLFSIISKNAKNGKYSSVEDVLFDVETLCNRFEITITPGEQLKFSTAFYNKYVNVEENEFADLFEEPENETEIILRKIEAYKAKLAENPANKISIQSMISKLRKKLRDLGYEYETSSVKVSEKSIESLKSRLEQLEVDLALAPMQKRKSVQSMISKIKKQLRDLGDTDFIKQPKEVKVKLTPAEKIGLEDTKDYRNYLINECYSINKTEPFNKLIILSVGNYAKTHNISIADLAKYTLKEEENIFSETIFPELNYTIIPTLIQNQTLKNMSKMEKSKASLSFNDIEVASNLCMLYNVDFDNEKIFKKIAKCQSINAVKKVLNSLD